MSQECSVATRVQILKDRSIMLGHARHFFHERAIQEVDCPCLSRYASVDAHIDLIPVALTVEAGKKEEAYLHSSPEYGMKRLLAEGIGDIYQLSHVFRDGEYGSRHNPEFMMAEWYRVGLPFEKMIAETVDFVRLFVGQRPCRIMSYKEAFMEYAGFDPYTISDEALQDHVTALALHAHDELRDDMLTRCMAMNIEHHLGAEDICVIAYYPPTQAALAKTCMHEGNLVAERFEVYYKGIELANGYHELQDAKEQLKRLEEANRLRQEYGKEKLAIDMRFIVALEKGIPECSGVAVGFDRLMMLRHHKEALSGVVPFDWSVS